MTPRWATVVDGGRSMLWFVLTSLAVGLPVAVVARAVLVGPRPLSLWAAVALGVPGALVGALLARALLGDAGLAAHPLRRELAGPLLGSVAAVLIGWAVRVHTYRSGPRTPRPRPWAERAEAVPAPAPRTYPGARVLPTLEDNVR